MQLRFIKFKGSILLVRGITYNPFFDPPDVYVAVNLKSNVFKAYLDTNEHIIPIAEAEEITDKKTIQTLAVLYGFKDDRK